MNQMPTPSEVPVLNLRSLVFFLSMLLDQRVAEFRKSTPYEKLRASDERVFVAASRNTRSISDIARILRISRQSVQSSIQRLASLGLLHLVTTDDNKRDKIVMLTERGQLAAGLAAGMLSIMEGELTEILGDAEYAQLRASLVKILSNYRGGEFLPRVT